MADDMNAHPPSPSNDNSPPPSEHTVLASPPRRHSDPPPHTSSPSPALIAVNQALHVNSITNHVRIELTQTPPNYAMWRHLFLVTLGKFNLLSHVDGTSPSSDESWSLLDYTVLSWIYATISPEIFSLIMRNNASAYDVWVAIEDLFRDNKKARAIQLEAEFRALRQGSMTINDYCVQLKSLADALADVDSPVSDENLVLQTLSGLNDTYSHLRSIIQFQRPFPSFQQVRSSLILEETCRQPPPTTATALISATPSSLTTTPGANNPPPSPDTSADNSQPQQSRTPNSRQRRGRGNRGRGRGNSSRPSFQQQLLTLLNSQPPSWSTWSAPGILGPRPQHSPAPAQTYYHTTAAPQWDQQSLVSALNAMTSSPRYPPDPQWYMDTGATTHMTPHTGSTQQDRDPPLQ